MSFAIDVNIFLYASDAGSPFHASAVKFLKRCATGPEVVCLAWPTIMGYLRMATHPAIFAKPLSAREAMSNVEALLGRPHMRVLGEEEGFWNLYSEVATSLLPRGNLVPDVHLAVLMLQHGVDTIYTHDRDFRKFDFLRVLDPLEPNQS